MSFRGFDNLYKGAVYAIKTEMSAKLAYPLHIITCVWDHTFIGQQMEDDMREFSVENLSGAKS